MEHQADWVKDMPDELGEGFHEGIVVLENQCEEKTVWCPIFVKH